MLTKPKVKTFKVKVAAIAATALLLASCHKDTFESNNAFSLKPSVEIPFYKRAEFFKIYEGIKTNEEIDKAISQYHLSSPSFTTRANYPASNLPQESLLKAAKKDSYAQILDEIIESEALKALLNNKGEMIVNDSLYTITPHGTFIAGVADSADLRKAVNKAFEKWPIVSEDDYLKEKNFLQLSENGESFTSDGILRLNNRVIFIATFKRDSVITNDRPLVMTRSNIEGLPEGLDNAMFSNLEEHEVTNANGTLFKTIFKNSTEYNYFSKHYRTSVLFYNRNYGIIKTLGMKVKQQKKGMLWWNKTNAQEIVAGFTTLHYTTPSIPSITEPQEQFDNNLNKAVLPIIKDKELFQVVIPWDLRWIGLNTDWVHEQFPKLKTRGKIGYTVNEIKEINRLVKIVFDQIKKRSAAMHGEPEYVRVYNIVTNKTEDAKLSDLSKASIAFAFPENGYQGGPMHIILGPQFVHHFNDDKIEYDFEFSTIQPKTTINLNTGNINFDLPKAFKEVFGSHYKIKNLNAFGTSKRNGEWRGIVIYRALNDDDEK